MASVDEVSSPIPMRWQINGLSLRGLSWGDGKGKPLLALHGWLDNAASFCCLAPLLKTRHVVALDLSGHGLSSWRSPDACYQIWDDLPEILGVLDALGWQHFDLLGHSRGAIISMLLASVCPERVEHLVLLDAVYPQAVPDEDFSAQLRKSLQDKPRLLGRPHRVFATVEQAVAFRRDRGLPAEAALELVQRNLQDCEGGYRWTTDPRLQGASAVKLTEGQIHSALKGLSMPTLLLLAKDPARQHPELANSVGKYIDRLVVEVVAGGHHFHMEPGVPEVARRVEHFLKLNEGPESA